MRKKGKSFGQDVHQVATHKLYTLKVHRLVFISVTIAFVAHQYAVIIDRQDAGIGDGDAMAGRKLLLHFLHSPHPCGSYRAR